MSSWARNPKLLGLAFLALGSTSLVILIAGEGEERLFGLAGTLMFGGGGVAWLLGEVTSRRAEPMRLETLRLPSGERSPALVLPIPVWKARAGVVGVALVFGAAILLVFVPGAADEGGAGTPVLLAGCAVILGVILVFAVPRLRGPAPLIALTPSGLLARAYGSATFLPWDEIQAVELGEVHGQPLLYLHARRADAILREGASSVLRPLERPLTGSDASFGLTGVRVPPEEVLRLVRHYLEVRADRATLGTALPRRSAH